MTFKFLKSLIFIREIREIPTSLFFVLIDPPTNNDYFPSIKTDTLKFLKQLAHIFISFKYFTIFYLQT